MGLKEKQLLSGPASEAPAVSPTPHLALPCYKHLAFYVGGLIYSFTFFNLWRISNIKQGIPVSAIALQQPNLA